MYDRGSTAFIALHLSSNSSRSLAFETSTTNSADGSSLNRASRQANRATRAGAHAAAIHRLFARLLAVAAAEREGQRGEPLDRDLFAALDAVALAALVEPPQRGVDARHGLGLHLNHGEVDVAARIGLGDVLFVGPALAAAVM